MVAGTGRGGARGRRHTAAPSPTQPKPGVARGDIGAAVLFVGLALLIYAPALAAGFIWDDDKAITDNLGLRSLSGLFDIWAGHGEDDYLPVKSAVLWFVYQLFGARPSPYHVLNVVAHAANAALLWRVLRRLAIPGAWLAGLVFLVHPTHVESVAWVSECKNTLSLLFALLAVLAWFRYELERRARTYVVALVLFIAALLCKNTVVIVPVVLLLLAWWQGPAEQPATEIARRDQRLMRSINQLLGVAVIVTGIVTRALWPVTVLCLGVGSVGIIAGFLAGKLLPSRRVPRTLAFFQVAVLLGAVTVSFQFDRAIGEYQIPIGGMASRVANAGKATWWYLAKSVSPTIVWYEMPDRPVETEPQALAFLAGARQANPAPAWPSGRLTTWPLAVIYPRWRVTPPVWYDFLPLLALAALFAWIARHRDRWGRGLFLALSYFLVALSPVVGLVRMSYMRASWVADHFQYLANIGIIALGCAAGTVLWRRAPPSRRWLVAGVGGAVIAAFGVCTFVRAMDYRSEYTMWTDTVAKNPDAWQAHFRLGGELLARMEVPAAAAHFTQGLQLKPDDPYAHNYLGTCLVAMGRVAEGIEQYRESLRLKPDQFFPHPCLGDALASQKKYAEAIAEYRTALRWNRDLPPLLAHLGAAYMNSGRLDEAVETFTRARSLAPDDAEISAALTQAQMLRGQAP